MNCLKCPHKARAAALQLRVEALQALLRGPVNAPPGMGPAAPPAAKRCGLCGHPPRSCGCGVAV